MIVTTTVSLSATDTIEAVGQPGPSMLRLSGGAFEAGSYIALPHGRTPADLDARVVICDKLAAAVARLRAAAVAEARVRGYSLPALAGPDDDEDDDEDGLGARTARALAAYLPADGAAR